MKSLTFILFLFFYGPVFSQERVKPVLIADETTISIDSNSILVTTCNETIFKLITTKIGLYVTNYTFLNRKNGRVHYKEYYIFFDKKHKNEIDNFFKTL